MGKPKVDFHHYFGEIYGERWGALAEALRGEALYETLHHPGCRPYHLDRSSAAAARALGVEPGNRVLDLCAAPGGKSLLLATALQGRGELISNEKSALRRERLRRVIDESLPESLRSVVQVTGHDAERWGLYEKEAYDRILLDAPCSSERHLLAQPKLLKEWSPARSKQLARRQHAMICAAFDALKPGGTLAYCTCALSPAENDGVVGKLFKSRGEAVELLPLEIEETEATQYGRIALPDKTGGAGPLYCALLTKR